MKMANFFYIYIYIFDRWNEVCWWDSLSSSVLCSTARVRILTFSGGARGRRGVMRLTAAVLRKRLALPSVGELNQLGRAKAPPMATAPDGLCSSQTHAHTISFIFNIQGNVLVPKSRSTRQNTMNQWNALHWMSKRWFNSSKKKKNQGFSEALTMEVNGANFLKDFR